MINDKELLVKEKVKDTITTGINNTYRADVNNKTTDDIKKPSSQEKMIETARNDPSKEGVVGSSQHKNFMLKEDVDNETTNTNMNDPTAFWLAWTERQKSCFDEDGNPTHQSSCNCFEGLGSVM